MNTVFLRTLEELHDKESSLREAIRMGDRALGRQRFDVDPQSFSSVPGSPFVYWVSDRLRALFKELALFESEGRVAKRGVNSNDDQRFLRLSWESRGLKWIPHVKGGIWSPYYADPHMLVNWGTDGAELEAERITSRVYKFAIVPSRELYFRPGLTWPLRTKSDLSLRAMPRGCIFGSKGPAVIVHNDDPTELLCLLAIGNSQAFRSLVEFQLAAADAQLGGAARSYEVGVIQRTPLPQLTPTAQRDLARLSRSAWLLKRSLDTRNDVSHAFTLPALLQVTGANLTERAAAWWDRVRSIDNEIAAIQADVDARCFAVYGISDVDRRTILEGFGGSASGPEPHEPTSDSEDDGNEEEVESDAVPADEVGLAAELVSWAVGVAMGRFDVRQATGGRSTQPVPDPFDPLPACSPGTLIGEDGLPSRRAAAGYPIAFPENGVLVDDPGHARDLTKAVRGVFEVVFGPQADGWWNDVATVLDPRNRETRAWLVSGLFEYHIRRHSKSRRKAPILWQLSTPSGRYGVWLYAHRLTRDSFFQIQNDVVGPKLAHEERQLTTLLQSAGGSPSSKDRKEIAAQAALVEELRNLLDEVKRVSPLWNPTFDDGVVLVMAPLWRLVPQHKPWQNETQRQVGRAPRRHFRLGTNRNAPLAGARGPEVCDRSKLGDRPRA